MGCPPGFPPELNDLILSERRLIRESQRNDGQTDSGRNASVAAEKQLAKDRQELLEQQIAVANSQVWALENKDFLVGASPDGEDDKTEDYGDDDPWYEGYYWDEWWQEYLPNNDGE